MANYGIKIDKTLLLEFFTLDVSSATAKHFKEIDKVFAIVMSKWFSKWYYISEDLRGFCRVGLLNRHDAFDIEKGNAYNYIFTFFRNEIGNKIKTLTREIPSDQEGTEEYNTRVIRALSYTMEDIESLPPEVKRYQEYLLGTKEFTCIRIPKKDVLPLLLFLREHDRVNVKLPEFLSEDKKTVRVLYQLLKELVELNYE